MSEKPVVDALRRIAKQSVNHDADSTFGELWEHLKIIFNETKTAIPQVEALYRRIEELEAAANLYDGRIEEQSKRIAELEAENAELRKDKGRLDFLGGYFVSILCSGDAQLGPDHFIVDFYNTDDDGFTGATIREAIDAARKEEQK